MLLLKVLVCIAIFLGAVAFLIIHERLKAYKIRKQEEFASTIGMSYLGGDEKMYTRFCGFDLMLNRRNVSVYNLFRADTEDLEISVFELNYQTGKKYSQNHGRWIDQSVVAVAARKFDFPSFTLESDNILPEQCNGFFAPKLINYVSSRQGLVVEGFETRLLIYHPGKTLAQSEYRSLIEDGFEVFQILNEYAEEKQQQMLSRQHNKASV